MKRILPLILAVFSSQVFAQQECYDVISIPYTPDPFSEGINVSLGDDGFTDTIPIGFDFCFFGITYDYLIIGSNAIVSFDTSLATTACAWNSTTAIPYDTEPDVKNAIMGPWQDMNPGLGGTITYASYGIEPFRRFVVSYDQIPMYTCTDSLFSNQIVIYESSNAVDVYIESKYFCPTWNEGASIEGIMDSTGTEAYWVPGRNYPTQWEAFEDAYRFIPTCYCEKESGPNQLTGRVYMINDLDCISDPDEVGISNAVVELSPGSLVWTDANGNFQTQSTETSVTVSQQTIPYLHQACPFTVDYELNGPANGQLYTGLDFGNIVDESCVDLMISEGNAGLRHCEETEHIIEYCNLGTEAESDVSIIIEIPDGIQILSSSLPYTIIGGGAQAIFEIGTLEVGECGTLTYTDEIPCNFGAGTTLCYNYAILPNEDDCDPSNNVIGPCQTTYITQEGNHKLVQGIQTGVGYVESTGHMTAGNQYQLQYIIRFQNTTSETQTNLQIIDELSPYFDITSLQPGISSHPYQVGASNGTLTFDFTNINLPPSATNEEESKGFIMYSIGVDTAALAGDVLNDATIRFGQDMEFQTNMTTVTLQPEGVEDIEKIGFSAFPNPTNGMLFVNLNDASTEYQLELLDQHGRLVGTWSFKQSAELDIKDVAVGIYNLRLSSEKVVINRKLIKN